ncbi:MAG: deoxyguanosinetriphosphate triphosphohydrolase-like protein [bacterium]|nr:MAG: deoxyguanosinetriphosphate triphosphohydrolase-like protein [bacterium]
MLNQCYEDFLNDKAARSIDAERIIKEQYDPVRTPYAVDRDRILYSKAFRRLKHKTQVFIAPEGDHFISRLTHTLEVSQIARTIARALKLNEELCEAIALGHDLGHTPFGHAGEEALNEITNGRFTHARQSLRVVDSIENNGSGLNLTLQVRNGIALHSKGTGHIIPSDKKMLPNTLEGQIVRISDLIAYANHDTADAIRSSLITEDQLPKEVKECLGITHSKRIAAMVIDIIDNTIKNDYKQIVMSEKVFEALKLFRTFLYKAVYHHNLVRNEAEKAKKIVKALFYYICECNKTASKTEDTTQSAVDYISGMTDQFAINYYKSCFIPKPWR